MRTAWLALGVVVFLAACKESDEERVDRLIARLDHEDPHERWEALRQLRRAIAVPRPTDEERTAYFSDGPIVSGPRELTELQLRGAAAVDRLLGDETDRDTRMEAASILNRLRPPGRRPGLLQCALHGDHYVASSCVQTLLYVSDPANLPDLVGLLRRRDLSHDPREPSDPGRSALASLLGRTESHLVPYLAQLVEEADANAIPSILSPLANIGTDESCALVARVAMNPDVAVRDRYLALYVLGGRPVDDRSAGGFCDRAAQYRDQLEELRDDPELPIRCKAACILGEQMLGCEGECSPLPPPVKSHATSPSAPGSATPNLVPEEADDE